MNTLSIILSFYDRDESLIESLTDRIQELAKDYHDYNIEYLIVDDRKDKTNELPKSKKFMVKPYRGNKGLLYSRWYGFTHSSGDFIWFIDADDEIISIPKFNESIGINIFNYYEHDELVFDEESQIITKHEIMTIRNLRKWIKVGLWNKVFRRDLVESVYGELDVENNKKKFEKFFALEDSVFNFTALKYFDEFQFNSQIVYKWLHERPTEPYPSEDVRKAIVTIPKGFRRKAYVKLLDYQGYIKFYKLNGEELLNE